MSQLVNKLVNISVPLEHMICTTTINFPNNFREESYPRLSNCETRRIDPLNCETETPGIPEYVSFKK